MIIKYEVSERKPLVKAVSDFTGAKAVYLRAPSYGYQIDYFTIDREGNLVFDDSADSEEIEKLIEHLAEQGFVAKEEGADSATQADSQEQKQPAENDATEAETATDGEIYGLVISIPADKVGKDNLEKLFEVKGSLIKKAFGIDDLSIDEEDGVVCFPWFSQTTLSTEEAKAYAHFVSAICEMSVQQKRITAKEKAVDNEKYAFRCFLLRLGFIGKDYKVERKILLKNFSGSSAFKSGNGKKVA